MRFALLLAAVAAVQVTQTSNDDVEEIFHQVDRNGNGEINKRELVRAIRDFAKENHYKPTRKDWRWVRRAARKADADNSRSLDLEEFRHFVKAFVKHYGLDKDDDSDSDSDDEGHDEKDLHKIFNHVDTSHDGFINE